MHKRLHKSSLSLALNYQIKDGRIYRLLAPSAAGIGVPLVPTEGRDEPRKTAKYGKPTQIATLPFFVSFYTALRQGSGTGLRVPSWRYMLNKRKNGKMFFLQQIRKHTKAPQKHRPKDNHQLSTTFNSPHIAQS